MRESQGVWLSYCIWCVQFTLHWQRHPRDQQQKLEETKCVVWMIRGGLIEGMSSKMMHSNVLFSSKASDHHNQWEANIISFFYYMAFILLVLEDGQKLPPIEWQGHQTKHLTDYTVKMRKLCLVPFVTKRWNSDKKKKKKNTLQGCWQYLGSYTVKTSNKVGEKVL